MIPRFSIYADIETWRGDIQSDLVGAWTRWKAVEPYITYALEHGYEPPIESIVEQFELPLFEEWCTEQATKKYDDDDMYELPPTIDDTIDVYDTIMRQVNERFDDEV